MHNEKLKTYFWLLLDALLLVLVLGILLVGLPALDRYAASLPASRTLMVNAEGKTFASPDLAELSFSVVSQGKNPQELADANNQKMNAAIAFLKSQSIDEKDMTTTAYDLAPNSHYDENTARTVISGYTLTQTLSLKVRDLAKVAGVIGGLTPLGVNQIGSVNFTLENPDTALAAARADAFAKAQTKAQEMADENHFRLGRIVNVSEYHSPWPIPYGMSAAKAGMGGGMVAAPTIEPGTNEMNVNVTLTYEIE